MKKHLTAIVPKLKTRYNVAEIRYPVSVKGVIDLSYMGAGDKVVIGFETATETTDRWSRVQTVEINGNPASDNTLMFSFDALPSFRISIEQPAGVEGRRIPIWYVESRI